MDPDLRQTLQRAHTEFNLRNFQQAEQLYSCFISHCLHHSGCDAADLATAFNNRGQIRYFGVDFTEAIEDYSSAIRTQGHFEVPHYNRGLIHYRLGFFEEARKDFEQTLKLNPNFEEAKVSLRQTLLDQQQQMERGF